MAQPTISLDHRTLLSAELARYATRRVTNSIVRIILLILTAIAVLTLLVIVGYVVLNGLSTLFPVVDGHLTFNVGFFTKPGSAPGDEDPGGVFNGIVGTLEMLAIGAFIAVPIGLGTAIYLSEYAVGRLGRIVRFIIDLLAGLPSVLVGLFIWMVFIHTRILDFSGLAGALGLMIIIIPIVASSVEAILRLVPDSLREAGLALGLAKWRVILRIVLPTVSGGVATGILLSLARAAGETAPLLLTTAGSTLFTNTDPLKPMTSLTLQIYNYATSAYPAQNQQAWGNALVLISVIAMFSAAVRYVTGRNRYDQ